MKMRRLNRGMLVFLLALLLAGLILPLLPVQTVLAALLADGSVMPGPITAPPDTTQPPPPPPPPPASGGGGGAG